jgi:RNA polymerase sigma factor (sigma-70 family)
VNVDKHNHITDAGLLENFNGDRDNKWLGILLQRYTLLLFGVCMKYLKNEEAAKDAVQQVNLKAITELHKYKVEYAKSWLYMIAKNYCLMQLRDKGNRYPVIEANEQMALQEEDVLATHKKHLHREKIFEMLEESMKLLAAEQQQCIKLFYLNKKSYQQIANETGFTMLNVKSFIQNGKRNLKIMLQQKLKNAPFEM